MVNLSYVGSQVVVRGKAKDIEEATHILRAALVRGHPLFHKRMQEIFSLRLTEVFREMTDTLWRRDNHGDAAKVFASQLS